MAEYLSPGAYAEEIQNTIAPSPVANESIVAIFSEVPATRPEREIMTLSGVESEDLSKMGADPDTVRLFSRDLLVEYFVDEHFSVSQVDANTPQAVTSVSRLNNSVTDETFTLDSGTKSYTLQNPTGVHDIEVSTDDPEKTYQKYVDYTFDRRQGKIVSLASGTLPMDGTTITVSYKYGIEDGETVVATYRYADEAYYAPQLYDSFSDVRRQFGESFDSNDNVNRMSLAAQLVFANGGPDTEVLCIPISPYFTGEKTQPNLADWHVAIDNLTENPYKPSMLCETSGTVDVQSYLINFVADTHYYRRTHMAFLGRDSKVDDLQPWELREYAQAINNERVVVVSDATWETLNYLNGDVINVGGQFGATALAGCITNMRVQESATRRSLVGIRTPSSVSDMESDRNTVAGLCQMTNNRGFMSVRHATTTAYGNVNTREINVIRQKDFVIRSLREILDRTVIGRLMQPNIEEITSNTATAILEQMTRSYIIAQYSTPQVFQNTTDPTRLDLSFEYLPNYAVNVVFIQFSLSDLGTIGTSINAS